MHGFAFSMSVAAAAAVVLVALGPRVTSATLSHGFESVQAGMFGWIGKPDSDEMVAFYAANYPLVVMSGSDHCNATDPGRGGQFELARRLKAANPSIKILLYEQAMWGALCFGQAEFLQHPDWWLRDDNGVLYNRTVTVDGSKRNLGPEMMDWRVPAARDWWVHQVTQAHDGQSLFDGLLVDSAGPTMSLDNTSHFMSFANFKTLVQAKMDMLGQAKEFFRNLNGGEVIGNPTLEWWVIGNPSREAASPFPQTYHWQYLTGTLDEMYGGFSSQQPDGNWNATLMNMSINAIVESTTTLNATVLVRGYPGPCSVPFVDVNISCVGTGVPCPPSGYTPTPVSSWPEAWPDKQPETANEFQAASVRYLEQALAPYLIIAGPTVWWSYAYFYESTSGWYPSRSQPNSTLAPPEWYPELRAALGPPRGPAMLSGE